ncbi:hypothetical protein FB45DRAFT_1060389 [Roridomyces roridus]|uniref:BTB domain-containing protein n=1 Tax=Roridomyces roridus TaxID=1738132 RepID=A0AAD7BMX4_9AGAR|nr:hypothetical protein FB45DRAFT_1060389 [Roridomyces roridus]
METSQLEAQNEVQKTVHPVDESLWFSSDMVILRAKSRKSKVFAAIFKRAQSVVFFDIVPVVDLHDDPNELAAFLRAIFYSNFYMPPPAIPQFSDTIGILRLSNKYQVLYLRCRTLQHLGNRGRGWDPNDLFHCIATIQVATEVKALWLLPYAYYDLCKFPVAVLLSSPHWNLLGKKERHTALACHSTQAGASPEIVQFLITWTAPDECRNLVANFTNQIPWQQMMSCPLEVSRFDQK